MNEFSLKYQMHSRPITNSLNKTKLSLSSCMLPSFSNSHSTECQIKCHYVESSCFLYTATIHALNWILSMSNRPFQISKISWINLLINQSWWERKQVIIIVRMWNFSNKTISFLKCKRWIEHKGHWRIVLQNSVWPK